MTLQRTLKVAVRDGLHARPASQLVQLAKSFNATIEIERDGLVANARSSIRLMLLAIKEADEVILRASGDDAGAAMDRVAEFLCSAGEAGSVLPVGAEPSATVPLPTPPAGHGVPASAGIAAGPAFCYFPPALPEPTDHGSVAGCDVERRRLQQAIEEVRVALRAREGRLSAESPARPIVGALVDMATDPEWHADMARRMDGGDDAYAAVVRSGSALVTRFEATGDPLLRARAEDLRSLTRELGCKLLGLAVPVLHDVPEGAIVVAEELTVLDLAGVDLRRLGGMVCRRGAAASHAAIVARAYGVPAVFGLDVVLARLETVQRVALDGSSGQVLLDPDAATFAAHVAGMMAAREARRELQVWRDVAPRTRAGREMTVAANLGALAEIDLALEAGAMGVGLFRTELLFLQHRTLPDEATQTLAYRRLADAFHPHPVVIRTLDIGGDKPVGGLDLPKEENPFLGWRGVRLCLDRPDLFRPQLRALLRAAESGNLKVMVPMVSTLSEVRRVRALLLDCGRELKAEGLPCGEIELGIMIETPAAVLMAPELAEEVDFFSIGTNDLTQYVMAADRGNARVAGLYRSDDPAVLRAIRLTCEAAARADIWVGVCGEAAADPALLPFWLEMGVRELSMSPASILPTKQRICSL